MVGSSSRGPLEWWHDVFGGGSEPSGRSAILHSLNGASVALAAIAHGVRGSVTTVSSRPRRRQPGGRDRVVSAAGGRR